MLKIAFIAHDRKKEEMVNFVTAYEHVFKGTSCFPPERPDADYGATKLSIHRYMSGPLGGDQQIGAMVATK